MPNLWSTLLPALPMNMLLQFQIRTLYESSMVSQATSLQAGPLMPLLLPQIPAVEISRIPLELRGLQSSIPPQIFCTSSPKDIRTVCGAIQADDELI